MINSIAALPRLPLGFSPFTLHLFRLLHADTSFARAENCRC
jgi:hypothetical protein